MTTQKSFCPLCEMRCSLDLIIEGNEIAGVKNGRFLPGGELCVKGRNLPQVLNSPKRLRYPLKRTGPRGSGKWENITWEEALSQIVSRVKGLREQFGPWAVAWDQGFGNTSPYLARLMNLLGSPNVVSRSHVCSQPRKIAQVATFGGMATPDVDQSKLIVIWGRNKIWTAYGASANLTMAVRNGAKLLVVDPRKTSLARMATLWLPLRPGTDGALALGMLNVLIREELYDREFIREFTLGFSELARLASEYQPEMVSALTGLDTDKIVQAARMLASEKPTSLEMGNALDQHTNSFQAIRAILSLFAASGNLNRKGGNVLLKPLTLADITCSSALSPDNLSNRLGGKEYPLLSRYRKAASSPVFIDALLEGHPLRPRALIVAKGNPVVTLAQTELVKKALMNLDFLVVSDLVVTETAELADLILPAALANEGLELVTYDPSRNDYYYATVPKGLLLNRPLPRKGEVKTDTELIMALAELMGLGEQFWQGSLAASISERLGPLGLTLEELEKDVVRSFPHGEYGPYNTPSGKVEFSSSLMEKAGYPSLPGYEEPAESPQATPEIFQEYPLVFSSHKGQYFTHSAYRWVDTFRAKEPEPLVEIHPATAASFGVVDGQRVEITSPRGNCVMLAKVTEKVNPGMLHGVHGWGGEGNVNRLTANGQRDPVLSSSPLKSLLCRIRPLATTS